MKTLLARLLGIASSLLNFVWPLLKSEVGKFLADKRVQELALNAVEAAAKTDLDGDGKHEFARIDLEARAKALGIECARGWVATAIQAAYDQWMARRVAAGIK